MIDLNLDQVYIQVITALVTAVFLVLVNVVKGKIPKKHGESCDKLQSLVDRMEQLEARKVLVAQKLITENSNRHHRSIIAASLMQTVQEKLHQLEYMTKSIKTVQKLPNLMRETVNAALLKNPTVSAMNGFNISDMNLDFSKKYKVKTTGKQDEAFQSKVCKTWGVQSRKNLKQKKSSSRKLNCPTVKKILMNELFETETESSRSVGDCVVYRCHIHPTSDGGVESSAKLHSYRKAPATTLIPNTCKKEKDNNTESSILKELNFCETIYKPQFTFEVGLVNCYKGKKRMLSSVRVGPKNRKTMDVMEESLKMVNIKTQHIHMKHITQKTGSFKNFTFKVPIKKDKKKIILKCIVSFIKTGKHTSTYSQRLATETKVIHSLNNSCQNVVQSNKEPSDKLPRKKRNTLYTDTSFIKNIAENIETSKETCDSNLTPYLAGDSMMLCPQYHSAPPQYTAGRPKLDSQLLTEGKETTDEDPDKVILQQCIDLSRDCFESPDNICNSYFPHLMYRLSTRILPTIEEERFEDVCEHYEFVLRDIIQMCVTQDANNNSIDFTVENYTLTFDDGPTSNEYKITDIGSLPHMLDYSRSLTEVGSKSPAIEFGTDESNVSVPVLKTSVLVASERRPSTMLQVIEHCVKPVQSKIHLEAKSLTCMFRLSRFEGVISGDRPSRLLNEEISCLIQNLEVPNHDEKLCSVSNSSLSTNIFYDNANFNSESSLSRESDSVTNSDKSRNPSEGMNVEIWAENSCVINESVVQIDNENSDKDDENRPSKLLIIEGTLVGSANGNYTEEVWCEGRSEVVVFDGSKSSLPANLEYEQGKFTEIESLVENHAQNN